MDYIFKTLESKTREITEKFITIGGEKFECADLYETLCAVEDGDVILTFTKEKIAALKAAGIIENEGSQRWFSGATLGENGAAFTEKLGEMLYD